MLYLSQLLGKPVSDSNGVVIGHLSDLAIQTGEVFPRITSLAFQGPAKTPFMVSWRKYVADAGDNHIVLSVPSTDIRFSYLQPDELLLARDLLNKQIVDIQGLKVVRVNDLKLADTAQQLRLLGAEVGPRGLLRSMAPWLEKAALAITGFFGHPLEENIIAWNYMDLVDHNLTDVQLSLSHRRLAELHPADVADILEQLDPQQRARVFDQLEKQQAAETLAELEDEYQSDLFDDLSESKAVGLLAQMDPDDAADILGDLPYEKAEKLLWLMGISDEKRIRMLLGYKEKTAGGIMTPEFVALPETATVDEAVEYLRALDENHERVHYVYTLDSNGHLVGSLSLRSLVLADKGTLIGNLTTTDLITITPEVDQEEVAELISKYDLLAIPVVDESQALLGIVTVDDAMDVLEEEHSEDLQIFGASSSRGSDSPAIGLGNLLLWLLRRQFWFILWALTAISTTLAGLLPALLPALIVAPFVLLMTQEIIAYAFNDLLEYGPGEVFRVGRLFLRNIAVSLIVALAVSGLGLVLYLALGSELIPDGTTGRTAELLQNVLVTGLLPALLVVILVIISSVFITMLGHRRLEKDHPLSVFMITFLGMLLALVLLFGLQYLTATLLVGGAFTV